MPEVGEIRSDHMQLAADAPAPPPSDKAQVVFLRPSGMGWLDDASIHDITEHNIEFIGLVTAKTRIAHNMEPGTHRFMVVGENADFMEAELEGGKIYYVVVTIRPGYWAPRFSLLPVSTRPVTEINRESDRFIVWMRDETRWAEMLPSAEQSIVSKNTEIEELMVRYLVRWNEQPPEHIAKRTMLPEDGVIEWALDSRY